MTDDTKFHLTIHRHYRPASDCYFAGFCYALGAMLAVSLTFCGLGAWNWLVAGL